MLDVHRWGPRSRRVGFLNIEQSEEIQNQSKEIHKLKQGSEDLKRGRVQGAGDEGIRDTEDEGMGHMEDEEMAGIEDERQETRKPGMRDSQTDFDNGPPRSFWSPPLTFFCKLLAPELTTEIPQI